ncbi:dormancy-associated protein 2-like isoform X1 [Aphidius gifuensis]|uniref:dormancy-associated protein 2-like isoform X1 n=1 Tax=Aphidius gifuensis TaxID=684658 RepID=UPI001CDBBBE7|nr:dormancy-associated protein 2-like isoform X1 [Aphidius gifuensis]
MSNILLLIVVGVSCAYAYPATTQDGTVIVDLSPVNFVRPTRSADPGHHHHHHGGDYDDHYHGHDDYHHHHDDHYHHHDHGHYHGYGGHNNGYGGYGQNGYGNYGQGYGGYGNYGQPNYGGYGHSNNGNSYAQASADSASFNSPFGGFSISSSNANSGTYSDNF